MEIAIHLLQKRAVGYLLFFFFCFLSLMNTLKFGCWAENKINYCCLFVFKMSGGGGG